MEGEGGFPSFSEGSEPWGRVIEVWGKILSTKYGLSIVEFWRFAKLGILPEFVMLRGVENVKN